MNGAFIRSAVFSYAFLHVIYYFFPLKAFFYLNLAVLCYILSRAAVNIPRVNKLVCLGLFLLGTGLMLYGGAAPMTWLKGLSRNGLLIALFVCAPLLNIPFAIDDYQSELKNIAKSYMHTMLPFYLLIAIPTHIFAALTGFAAFAIMYHLFQETSKLYNSEAISLFRSEYSF